jgi:hypothetical protein
VKHTAAASHLDRRVCFAQRDERLTDQRPARAQLTKKATYKEMGEAPVKYELTGAS